ncbi:MAG: GNAT family N-acetyltransferase [Longimicrobiales bacterium]
MNTRAGLGPLTSPGTIRPLRTANELRSCVALQRETWGSDFSEAVPERVLGMAQRLGGILSGAFDENGELLGFVFGLTGVADGRVVHWSDMLAVRPGTRNRGIGEALKRHQRELLLAEGIAAVGWTFDPLESRNAHINFARLGVTAREYVRDFYGDSDSPLHTGLGTDRLIVNWAIAGERVTRRLAGTDQPPAPREAIDWPLINAVRAARAGPRSDDPDLDLQAPRLRLAIPLSIQEIKQRDPELATDWRLKTRAAFEQYTARGFAVVDFVRAEPAGFYILER